MARRTDVISSVYSILRGDVEDAAHLRVGGDQAQHEDAASAPHPSGGRPPRQCRPVGGFQRQGDAVHHRVEQVGLVLEMPVDGARVWPAACAICCSVVCETPSLKQQFGGVKDTLAGGQSLFLGATGHGGDVSVRWTATGSHTYTVNVCILTTAERRAADRFPVPGTRPLRYPMAWRQTRAPLPKDSLPVCVASRPASGPAGVLVARRPAAEVTRPQGRACPAAACRPPKVGVVVATPGDVGLVTELPGRLEASRVVAGARPRRRHPAGAAVPRRQRREGRPAAVPHRPRALRPPQRERRGQPGARRRPTLGQAKALAERYKPLVEANAVSKQEYANAVAAQKAAEADVARRPAPRCTPRSINLGYATVTAPISGRIGRALVTEGALVGQGEATRAGGDPADQPDVRQLHAVGQRRAASCAARWKRACSSAPAAPRRPACAWCWKTAPSTPQPGKLLFSDLTVDPTTGQITLRAEVPNPNGALLPGLYVRVRLEQAQVSNAITGAAAGRDAHRSRATR